MTNGTPVIILAGFLGAGKTTLLNHVLRRGGDVRLGVIVNDFGAVSIDAMMVASQVDGVVGFGNGCLCCAADSDDFEDAVSRLARTDVDAVLVEASGIADPRSMIRRVVGMADPAVAYGGMVYLVDAVAVDEDLLPGEALAHARVADLVVVNKADLVDDAALAVIEERLVQVNPSAPRLVTTEGAVDPGLLVDARVRPQTAGPEQLSLDALLREGEGEGDCAGEGDGLAESGAHLHADYQQYTWESSSPVNPRTVAQLLERPPTGCYRIKGWVPVRSSFYTGTLEFSAVGGRIRASRASGRDRGDAAATVIVLIGVGMDVAEAEAACAALTLVDGADEFGALSLLRYDPETTAEPAAEEPR